MFYHGWGSLILAIGAVMDEYMTGLWLPRAGAVVAGAAAYTYFFDPRTSDDWWALRRKGATLEMDLPNPTEPADGGKAEVAKARRRADQAAVAMKLMAIADERHITRRKAMRETNHLHHAALQAQGMWVLIGTFVWAFGDIPVELLKCGSVPC